MCLLLLRVTDRAEQAHAVKVDLFDHRRQPRLLGRQTGELTGETGFASEIRLARGERCLVRGHVAIEAKVLKVGDLLRNLSVSVEAEVFEVGERSGALLSAAKILSLEACHGACKGLFAGHVLTADIGEHPRCLLLPVGVCLGGCAQDRRGGVCYAPARLVGE